MQGRGTVARANVVRAMRLKGPHFSRSSAGRWHEPGTR